MVDLLPVNAYTNVLAFTNLLSIKKHCLKNFQTVLFFDFQYDSYKFLSNKVSSRSAKT